MKKTILIILMVIFTNSCAIYYGEEYFKSPDFNLISNKENKIGFIILDNGKVNEGNAFEGYKNFDDNDEFIDYLYSESIKQFKAHRLNVEAIISPSKIRKMNLIDQKNLKTFQYIKRIFHDNNIDFICLISSWKIDHNGGKYSTNGKLIQLRDSSVISLRITVIDSKSNIIFTGQAFSENHLGFLRTGDEFLFAVNKAVENMVKMYAGEIEKKNIYKE